MAEIPEKPYFLSIDKDQEHPKRDIFVVTLFYLLKHARGELKYQEEPFFTARLEVFYERGHWRPFRFFLPPLASGMDPRFLDDKLFPKLATSAAFCAVPETTDQTIQKMLQDLLQTTQAAKIEQFTCCESCLRKNRFQFIDHRNLFRGTNGAKLCRDCAGADLLIRVRDAVDASPNLRNVLRDLLNKFKDVDKVAHLFASNIHSLANEQISLYDYKKERHQKVDRQRVMVNQLPLPPELTEHLQKKGFKELLPAQVLAVEAGLFEGESELIISSTSSGKTLIAELAGIPKLLDHYTGTSHPRQGEIPKLIYLVPLVALANQRGDEWAHRYGALGLTVITKVGVKQFDLEARVARSTAGKSVQTADIVVGTYEGVDVLLRKGRGDVFGAPATIVIDEVQMLGDPERGWFLDGFISRLRSLYPSAQFLYLSATISEPADLAAQLHTRLVEYNGRPVPIERHFILCTGRDEKVRISAMLIQKEFEMTSKYGFKGQTIVFTNSRRNCHKIASTLQQMGISATAYHAGLTYGQRRRIEKVFIAQTVMCVVTTAALGAGIDLPASQVIFESLAMGRQWLTVAEFEQMLGRAGRMGKHERGKVVILAQLGNQIVPKDRETEEQVAMRLFKGKILPFALEPDDMRVATEILAFLAMRDQVSLAEVDAFYAKMYHRSTQPAGILRRLGVDGYLAQHGSQISITLLGRAVVEHFLTTEVAMQVQDMLATDSAKVLEFALEMHPFENLYVSNKMVRELAGRTAKGGGSGGRASDSGNHLYSSLVTDMLDANSAARRRHKIKGWVLGVLTNWATELFNCECKERPECDCARLNVERRIYSYVEEGQRDVPGIATRLRDELELALFPGDILSYLDALIHSLRAIYAIGKATNYAAEVAHVPEIIRMLTGVSSLDGLEDPDIHIPRTPLESPRIRERSLTPRVHNRPQPLRSEKRNAGETQVSPDQGEQSPTPQSSPPVAVRPPSPQPSVIRRPQPQGKYPKKSPFRKQGNAEAPARGLSVEEFVSHMNELASEATNTKHPPSPKERSEPIVKVAPTPFKPMSTEKKTKQDYPTKEIQVPHSPLPSKVANDSQGLQSKKRSPLGKLEKKKKRVQPAD